MQTNQVMPHMSELELLQGRNDFLAVMLLIEGTEREHEDWIFGIQCLHPMITALIDTDDDIAVRGYWRQINHPPPVRQ